MDINSISIKQQEPHDLPAICRLIEGAFAPVQESDHREQFLVNDNVPVPLRQTSEDEENQKLTRLEIKA